MCGIAGVWNPSSINREIFSKSLHTLNHRGPDNLGSWFSSDKKIGLGHTRLAIIGLDKSGNQPMVSSSGRFVITFNGEIYNYKELKEELLLKNPEIIFQSSSDTEILLFVIEYFGVFEGAQENNFKVLSVDVNRCVNAPGYIIDNTLKGVDAAILNSVDVIKTGAEASFTAVGLKEGGMGLMALKPDMLEKSKCLIAEQKEVLDEVRKAAEKIMDGSLEIKDPMFAN